jgi:hypothetical protein
VVNLGLINAVLVALVVVSLPALRLAKVPSVAPSGDLR